MSVRPVVLYGPTASGKSALALRIAARDGGCVINADASQVYACWRVLTARPDDDDLAVAPHLLYGHVACEVRYSAGAWLRDVTHALAKARALGLRPVIVGGTGLYLEALTEGLSDIPETPPDLRAHSEALIREGRLDQLRDEIAVGDPATFARIDQANPRRIQRAWEVLVATGRGLTAWQADPVTPLLPADGCLRLALKPEILHLNNNIASRFQQMLDAGALEECRRFRLSGHAPDVPSARVLGAEPLLAHLRGEIGLGEATDAAVTATRQFAKRQRTWLRNRMPDWQRLDPATADLLDAIPRS